MQSSQGVKLFAVPPGRAIRIGGNVAEADDRKLAEQIFSGSLAVLAVLIAVAGIVATGYDKISGNPDIEPQYKWYLIWTAGLSAVACSVGLVALERVQGRQIPMPLILWPVRVLMVGVALASVGLVFITLL